MCVYSYNHMFFAKTRLLYLLASKNVTMTVCAKIVEIAATQ